jgi:GntR family transcriptional repressor for pyruvate dehydrogenase complex
MALAAVLPVAKPETMVEATARALISFIAAEGLKAGDQLPSEPHLVEMTGVSRLPLREALSMLKGLGVVEARHGKGVFVKHLDMAATLGMLSPLLRTQADIELRHIVEVRTHLEPAIAGLAAQQRTDADLATLGACLEEMRGNLGERGRFVEPDMSFHQELARSTRNPVFHVIMASITDLLCQVQVRYPDRIEYRRASLQYHARVLEAVTARDSRGASQAMLEHLRNVGERLWNG